VASVRVERGAVVVSFSEPTINVNATTLAVRRAAAADACRAADPAVAGALHAGPEGDVYTFVPSVPLDPTVTYCVTVSPGVYDLQGQALSLPFAAVLSLAPTASRQMP
jgi:hypothetical protein